MGPKKQTHQGDGFLCRHHLAPSSEASPSRPLEQRVMSHETVVAVLAGEVRE
jgi:hypothetical protein